MKTRRLSGCLWTDKITAEAVLGDRVARFYVDSSIPKPGISSVTIDAMDIERYGLRMERSVSDRAAVHAALGDPVRLAMVDDLAVSDRSPGELAERFGLRGNLLAHHLDVLEDAGVIERFRSAGDQRRRYVRLVEASLQDLVTAEVAPP